VCPPVGASTSGSLKPEAFRRLLRVRRPSRHLSCDVCPPWVRHTRTRDSLSMDAKFLATHLLSQYRRIVQTWSRLFSTDGEPAKATMRGPSLLHVSITSCRPPSLNHRSSFPPPLPPNAPLLFSRAGLALASNSLAAPA
jgi:hypothetical protein